MKKVFLDTNIIMEYLAHRKEFDDVQLILSAAYQGGIQAVMSSGCVYTVIYLLGAEFKRQGIHEPEKREKIKESLSVLLEYIDVVDFSTVYVKNYYFCPCLIQLAGMFLACIRYFKVTDEIGRAHV